MALAVGGALLAALLLPKATLRSAHTTGSRKAAAAISKFTEQPIDIVRLNRPNLATPRLKDSDVACWVETKKEQDMLQSAVNLSKLILP